jgi:hypothetical protein
MTIEVSVRYFALRKKFWDEIWNYMDIFLILLCFFLFFVAFGRECSFDKTSEEMLEDSVMLFRNIVQFLRLVVIAHRNVNRTDTRRLDIQLSSMETGDLLYEPLDIDGDTNQMNNWNDYEYNTD